MINLFHSIFFVGKTIFQILLDRFYSGKYFCSETDVQFEPRDFGFKNYYYSKRNVHELKNCRILKNEDLKCRYDEKGEIKFSPPVYSQRYEAVKESMVKNSTKYKLTKVIDMGCAELSFFPFLKYLPGVEEIIELDVDSQLLESVAHRAAPLLADHLAHRTSPLHVLVLSGSVAQQDYRLIGSDIVIAIELIEHLYPPELEEFPFTVFGYIQPSVAIITTPNVDFNILFNRHSGFRNPDHKFEWTRAQFQDWGTNITKRYLDYEVEFHGIGRGPFGSDFLGCCSQMAIFTRKTPNGLTDDHQEKININIENNASMSEASRNLEIYSVVAEYEYPVYVDHRTEIQKMQDDLSCVIKNLAMRVFDQRWNLTHSYDENYSYPDVDYDANINISFEDILRSMNNPQLTETDLRDFLEGSEWNVKEINGKLVVEYPNDERSSYSEEEGEAYEEGADNECKREADSDWEQTVAEEKEYSSWPQNASPTQSCISDWNEEDTQTRAFVDSGYPNSFSAHDKDLANSIDLHGSSLEEDSGDEMEDDMHSSGDAEAAEQEEDDFDNQVHLNAAANPALFYEVANQDENQDLVNNNRDNEGNNAEAVFRVEHQVEEGLNVEELSDSEGSVMEHPSEEESELEDDKLRMRSEDGSTVERVVGQMEVEDSLIPSTTHWQNKSSSQEGHEAAGDNHHNVFTSDDLNQDEGFAEVVSSGITGASGDGKQRTGKN